MNMAKKRLNKKVAIIGSIVFVFLVLVIVAFLLWKSRDPDKFIADGDSAIQTKNYEAAVKSYLKAIDRAHGDPLKIEILYKLADAYMSLNDWRYIMACWDRIVQIDPANIQARLERIRYNYAVADSGITAFWQRVQTDVDEFLAEIDKKALSENLSKWNTFDVNAKPVAKRLDAYLYFLRGRAYLEKGRNKLETGTEILYTKAMEDLKKALETEPNNVEVHFFLAQDIILLGDELSMKGNTAQKEKSENEALAVLNKCIELSGGDINAYLNLINLKLVIADRKGPDYVKKLEPEYLALVQKFSTSAEAYFYLSNFYLIMGPQSIDKAAEAAGKAVELDKNNLKYNQTARLTCLYQYTIHGRQSPQLYAKCIEMAKNAIKMPEAQDTPGPHRRTYVLNRLSIYEFLASRYIEQILFTPEGLTDQKKQELIKDTEDAVYQMEQVYGSGENPTVVKWKALLDLAKGNKESGIRKLNTLYEQAGANKGNMEAIIPYALAKMFVNTNEQGSVLTFLESAINSGIARYSRPEAFLEFCEGLLKLEVWSSVIANIDVYEKFFTPTQKSRSIKILGYIGAGQFDDAQKMIASEPENDANTIKLNITLVQAKTNQIRSNIAQAQIEELSKGVYENDPNLVKSQIELRQSQFKAELAGLNDSLAKLIAKLSTISPQSVLEVYVATVCESYLAEGRIKEVKELVDLIARDAPENSSAKFYQKLLVEPQPDKVSAQKRREIEEQIYQAVAEPLERAMNLGLLYRRDNDSAKAIQQFKIVLGDYLQADDSAGKLLDRKVIQQKNAAVDYIFNLALQTQDWQLASDMTTGAKKKNVDGCEGNFFAARLAAAKRDPSSMGFFDECLKQKPIFSYGYLLRSNVRIAMRDEKGAIDDAKKAMMQNPLDGAISKNLASLLFQRNQALGKTVTENQKEELKGALDMAMRNNNGDVELFSFYAEFISANDPVKAIAIRQHLFRTYPSIENAVLLGQMAVRIAKDVTDQKQKNALFNIAKWAFQQGKVIEPANQGLLYSIADMYKAMGQGQQAEKVIIESKDQTLLWALYFQNGQYDEAKKILVDLYRNNPKDVGILRGLLSVAEKTLNKDDALLYGPALLAAEDNVENRLLQIQVYLNTGIVGEAEKLLQTLKEKYPNEPKAQYIEAWMLTAQGKLDKALDAVNQCIEKDQNYAPAWQLRGKIYLVQAEYQKANSDLSKCKLLSDDPSSSILLARTFLGMGRDENAIVELKSVADNPQVAIEAGVLLESIYIRLKKNTELKAFYDDVLQKNPDNIYWLIRAGRFALRVLDLKNAEQLYDHALRKSIEKGRASVEAFNGYLEALLLSGQTDKLFAEAKKHENDDLASVALIQMADAENRRGNKDMAVKYARDAADKIQNNETILYETLKAMYKIIGPKALEDYCSEKLAKNPSSLPANMMMYQMKVIAGDYTKAVESIDKCIEITKNDLNRKAGFVIQKASTLYSAYLKTSDKNFLKKAAIEYESLLKEMPKNSNADIMNNLAYMLTDDDERLPDALNYAKQAYEAKPNNPEYLDTYAFACYKNGKYTEAEQYIQSAIQMFIARQAKISWDVYERAGMIKEKLGARLQAVAAYKQALQAGTEDMTDADKTRLNAAIERLTKEKQ
jgi:tetratricopeptide (TPR) repeat protein